MHPRESESPKQALELWIARWELNIKKEFLRSLLLVGVESYFIAFYIPFTTLHAISFHFMHFRQQGLWHSQHFTTFTLKPFSSPVLPTIPSPVFCSYTFNCDGWKQSKSWVPVVCANYPLACENFGGLDSDTVPDGVCYWFLLMCCTTLLHISASGFKTLDDTSALATFG